MLSVRARILLYDYSYAYSNGGVRLQAYVYIYIIRRTTYLIQEKRKLNEFIFEHRTDIIRLRTFISFLYSLSSDFKFLSNNVLVLGRCFFILSVNTFLCGKSARRISTRATSPRQNLRIFTKYIFGWSGSELW